MPEIPPSDVEYPKLKDQLRGLREEVAFLRAEVQASRERMTRTQFMGQFFASAAAWDGSKVKFYRDWCESAYKAYCDACDGVLAPSLLSHYGGQAPAPIVDPVVVGPASMVIPPEPVAATGESPVA